MKYSCALLTLISAAFILAAPAPFVESEPVAASNILLTAASFSRRGEAVNAQAVAAMSGYQAQIGDDATHHMTAEKAVAQKAAAAADTVAANLQVRFQIYVAAGSDILRLTKTMMKSKHGKTLPWATNLSKIWL